MKKVENFLAYHTTSFVCFVFSFMLAFISLLLCFDYISYKEIEESGLDSINYVEGKITSINDRKGNIDIYIEGCNKEFFIYDDLLKDTILNEGDYLVVYYAKNNPFRGDYYRIVNLEVNNKVIYSLEEFKESNNLDLQLGGLIACSSISVCSFIIGLILMKRNKPVNDVRKFILANREKFNLSLEEAEEIISQFDNQEPALDRPKEEVYAMFKNSIYTKNGRTYTSALELVTNSAYDIIFFEVLADLVNEKELKVIYEDSVYDDSEIYLLYRINNKAAVINMLINEKTRKFDIDKETLYFMFEEDMEPDEYEIACFMDEVRKYNLYIDDIFEIEGE